MPGFVWFWVKLKTGECVPLLAVKSKDVLSAKSYRFESKISIRLLMNKGKHRGLRLAPSERPVLVSAHDECWSFKNTFYFVWVKKSFKLDNKPLKKHIAVAYRTFLGASLYRRPLKYRK